MLEAIGLTKDYNAVKALDGLTLRVGKGDIQPTARTACVRGLDVTKAPLESKKYLAYLPEQVMLDRNLFRAKESGTRVGIMKHGRLVATLDTRDLGHADLERIYLDHMHD